MMKPVIQILNHLLLNILKEITSKKHTCENKAVDEHGKIHVTNLSDTHVQPTLNTPTTLPEATKKSDTASTVNPNFSVTVYW